MIRYRVCNNNKCAYSHDPGVIHKARDQIAEAAALDRQGPPSTSNRVPVPSPYTRQLNAFGAVNSSSRQALAISNGESYPNVLKPSMQMREVLDHDDEGGPRASSN